MRLVRVTRRATTLAVVATLAVATAASAHPGFDPPEIPLAGTTTVTLQMAHGCGPDESADTIEVVVEPPQDERVVDDIVAQDEDGWTLETSGGDADTLQFTYRADGGAEPAPEFDIEIKTDADAADDGNTLYWRVFQGCGDAGQYRWIGTPDDPADDPAVEMTLVESDEDLPPPDGQADTDTPSEPDEPTATSPDETVAATSTPTPAPSATPSPSPAPTAAASPAGTAGNDAGSSTLPLLIGGLVLLAVIGAVVYSLRQRGADAR